MADFKYCPLCRTELVIGERSGRDRQLCPACDFVAWNNPIPVVAAIVEHDDCVILVRSRGNPEGWFGLVAGFLEPGELPHEGALREIEEEIGIQAAPPSFIGVYPFEYRNQIIFVYHTTVPHRNVKLCTVELDAYRIVPLDELRPWSRGTGPALREWLIGRGYTPETAEFGKHLSP